MSRPTPVRKSWTWRPKVRAAVTSARDEVRHFLRLFVYTRPYRVRLYLSWLATTGYAAASALLVSQVKPIFDKVLIQGVDVERVSLSILALYTLKGISSYFSTTLVAVVGQRAVTDLRNALYEHVLRQSFTFLNRNTTGSLMSHITTDVEKIHLQLDIGLNLVQRHMPRPLDHDLHTSFLSTLSQLAQQYQFMDLGPISRISQAAGTETIPERKGHVVFFGDLQQLVEMFGQGDFRNCC